MNGGFTLEFKSRTTAKIRSNIPEYKEAKKRAAKPEVQHRTPDQVMT